METFSTTVSTAEIKTRDGLLKGLPGWNLNIDEINVFVISISMKSLSPQVCVWPRKNVDDDSEILRSHEST